MVIVSCANKIPQLIGGRFVLGFGIAIMTVGAPAYCVEIAPAQWRGRFVGLYNSKFHLPDVDRRSYRRLTTFAHLSPQTDGTVVLFPPLSSSTCATRSTTTGPGESP